MTDNFRVDLIFIGVITIMFLSLAGFVFMMHDFENEEKPEQVEFVTGEHFEIEKVFEVRAGCRYDLFSVKDDSRTKVGYIRSHCKYDNGKNYLLSTAKDP